MSLEANSFSLPILVVTFSPPSPIRTCFGAFVYVPFRVFACAFCGLHVELTVNFLRPFPE